MADCARSVAHAASKFVGGAELDDSMVFSSLKATPARPVLQTHAEENPAPYARLRPGPCGIAMDAAADGSLLYSLLGVALGDRGGFPLGISGRTCSLVETVFFRAFAEAAGGGVADAFSRLLPSPLFCALAEKGGASGVGGDTTLRMTLTVGSGGGTLFLRVPHAWMGPAALDLAKSRL